MKRRHDRRIYLGFQWDVQSWEGIPAACDSLFGTLKEHGVHWNLPALPPDTPARKKTALVKMMRARLAAGDDTVTSMGFTGACHPLLNLDELAREVAWGLKNPWGTGINDLFDLPTPVMMPRVPDLARPDARRIYRENGFTRVGVCCDPLPRLAAGDTGFFPYRQIAAASIVPGGTEIKQVRRLISSADNLFLVLDLSGIDQPESLRLVLGEIVEPLMALGTSLLPFPDTSPSNEALPPAGWRVDWTPFPPPILHAKLSAVTGIARKKRKKNEEYNELLTLLGPGNGVANGECADTSDKTLLVAHMLGEVALTGTDFDVRLSGGRFCGATRRGKELLPRVPARSYMRLAGAAIHPGGEAARPGTSANAARPGAARTMYFKTLSSFSFEGESCTGLREELEIQGQDGTGISIKYSFRDESPLLSIDMHVRLPVFTAGSRIDEYAPLTLALRELRRGECVPVGVVAPDGSEASIELGEESGGVFLPGAAHRIRRADGGWIRLAYGAATGPRWGLPFFRVTRLRNVRMLEVNPFGSFAPMPGAALSGLRGTFSLQLGLDD